MLRGCVLEQAIAGDKEGAADSGNRQRKRHGDSTARTQKRFFALGFGQIEETIPDGQTVTRLQQDFDSLRTIAVVASSSGAGRGTAIGAARADRDRDLHAGQQCGASAAAAIDPVAARSQDFS